MTQAVPAKPEVKFKERRQRCPSLRDEANLQEKSEMDAADWLGVVSRILHVGTAIVLVGGAAFLRFALLPAAVASLTDEEHARLRQAVLARWGKFVHSGIAILLFSGAYNFVRAIWALRDAGVRDPLYHALIGIKILLAMGVFFVASVLVGRSAKFEAWRKQAAKWLTINLVLALLVVSISGFLKVRGLPKAASPVPPAPAEQPVER
jgi:uncharacterized membrane protein